MLDGPDARKLGNHNTAQIQGTDFSIAQVEFIVHRDGKSAITVTEDTDDLDFWHVGDDGFQDEDVGRLDPDKRFIH